MKWEDLHRRVSKHQLSGFSLPVVGGGLSWAAKPSERAVASAVLAHLEHKRVFEERPNHEVSAHVVESVLKIREFLSTKIEDNTAASDKLLTPLRGMRRACVDYLKQLPREEVSRAAPLVRACHFTVQNGSARMRARYW